ncbi:DUF5996 family protein [Tengunoibacter tsumagoiensis]|uniref:Ava_C0101 and related proteins n=1 Tax=Tengunoibacter tsumagoiensis TaxID=2014871 RepID=A0A402A6M9_9CHLR|nr:DUF5996 family protein [Tengunoibacter tsumagoiensis]GCE14792.1 hypothetical protein KTT_46510 [Tengunoibacter tsumagoiensis]
MQQNNGQSQHQELWPALPFADWKETCETLHMWTQIVGKLRLTLCSPMNHWWQVPLYLTTRGLTTSLIPYEKGAFEVEFDFLQHLLRIQTSTGQSQTLPLSSRSVAAFYRDVMQALHTLGIDVRINTLPQEVKEPIRFEQDEVHKTYDPVFAHRFWRILIQTQNVLERYRSPFIGKSSPIHFFWGSFDLALTFFSGRRAPARENADPVTREAYSHEVISAGFWPGNASFPHPSFYSYTAPVPTGLATAKIQPAAAHYNTDLGEFLLSYDDVRQSASPEQMILEFFQSGYEAGAHLAKWDRKELEKVM